MTFKFGSEFLVNSTTTSDQTGSSVTALADGRFVITWRDASATGGDTSDTAIRAQMYNADGSPSGAEFLVNATTLSFQFEPSVTALADGRFVVSWTDWSATGSDTYNAAVRAQVFNADGSLSGVEFLVNTTILGNQYDPSVTTLADGRFVVSWTDLSEWGGDNSGNAIRAQVFNADGSPSGTEFLVNTTTLGSQITSSITALEDGRFVVSWRDFSASGGDTSLSAIRAQVFNADGSASGSEFLVNTTTAGEQSSQSITALADGRFVVSWRDMSATGGDTSSTAIRAQVFNADGSASGTEFLVNTTTTNNQFQSSVADLADGRFVVSWTDESATGGDTSGGAIRAQVFNIDGSKSGAEFLVNTTTTSNQFQSSVTGLADGRFVVSWTDISASGGDTSGSAIRGQVFDPRETAVSLNGSLLDDDYVGTRYGDDISGFIGDDQLTGRSGDDDLFGGAGHDILKGNTGNDRLEGGDGKDKLLGGFGSDQLFGGAGKDDLNGGFGLDFHAGGLGNDTYKVDNIGDVVVEEAGEGRDQIRSSAIDLDLANFANVEDLRLTGNVNLDLTGNNLANKLLGNNGDNVILGGAGADTISGKAGEDTITGGLGRDIMTGGAGLDTFVFNDVAETGATRTTRDKITDFDQGEGDMIDLSAVDADVAAPGNQAFTFIGTSAFGSFEGQLRYVQSGSKTVIQGDIDGDGVKDFEIFLNGLVDLTAGDFVL